MLIGLVSDTHVDFPDERLPSRFKRPFSEKLPPQLKKSFSGVDLILHAGDILIPSVLDELEAIAPVMAILGDGDLLVDLDGDHRILKKNELTFDGVTLWLTHTRPSYPTTNHKEGLDIYRPYETGSQTPPHVIVFGHTHRATIENYESILLVNPGSATLPSYMPRLGTVALLAINFGKVEARIVELG